MLLLYQHVYSYQDKYIDSRDRGPGGISSEDFSYGARSAFVHNAIVRSLLHEGVTCHPPWTFPFVSQDLKSPHETPKMTIKLPDKTYPTVLCNLKCPIIRPQRYNTLKKPISGYEPPVGSDRVALMNIAVRTLGNGQVQHIPVIFTMT